MFLGLVIFKLGIELGHGVWVCSDSSATVGFRFRFLAVLLC